MPAPMRRKLPRNLKIEDMLKAKSFEQLLEDGDIFTVVNAAPLMDYSEAHIRYLCRENRIEHIERHGQYFLYARTACMMTGVARHVNAHAKRA